jgi:P-type Na+/K+ transporter
VATVIRYDLKQKAKNREGKAFTIPTEEVVLGDIIIVKIGDIVPADARIISGHLSNLECDEALLTGESLPVVKTTERLNEENSPVGDRTNMVWIELCYVHRN